MTAPGFFFERYSGKTPLQRLFWLDLLGVGTLVNLLFGFVALLMLANRMDFTWSLALHALIWPYNLFLVTSVWRHANASRPVKVVALGWLLTMLVV